MDAPMATREEFVKATGARLWRLQLILWGAMTVSPLLFVAVGIWLSVQRAAPPAEVAPVLRSALLGLAAALVAGSVVLRRALLTPARLAALPYGLRARPGLRPALQPETDAERRLLELGRRMTAVVLLGLSLSEASAIFGLVLTVLTGNATYVAVCGTVAFLIDVLFHRPPRGVYARLAKTLR
jgi:uncharacterized membrane protein